MDIILKSDILKIKKLNGKTSARMFKDLKIGDEMILEVEVERAGSNRGKTYATYIVAKNANTGESTACSFNEMPKRLSYFEFE